MIDELGNIFRCQPFCEGVLDERLDLFFEVLFRPFVFGLVGEGCHEESTPLPGLQETVAFETLVGALNRDDTDALFAGQGANGGQGVALFEVAGQDSGADLARDLTLKRFVGMFGEVEEHSRSMDDERSNCGSRGSQDT